MLSGAYARRVKEEAKAKRIKRRLELKEKALKEAEKEKQRNRLSLRELLTFFTNLV